MFYLLNENHYIYIYTHTHIVGVLFLAYMLLAQRRRTVYVGEVLWP